MIPSWVGRYVGIPFADAGDDITTGFNCYGLVRAVYAREANIDLPRHSELSAADVETANAGMKADIAAGPWLSVIGPLKLFDVVLARSNPMHVGVLISATHVLHVWRKTDSMIMSLDHPRLRNLIIGFYRHKDLA